MCVCVRACVRPSVRACVRACTCVWWRVVVWCGVVWYGVVWCGGVSLVACRVCGGVCVRACVCSVVMWCGAVRCVVWCGGVSCDVVARRGAARRVRLCVLSCVRSFVSFVRSCVRACVRGVRACVRACVLACVDLPAITHYYCNHRLARMGQYNLVNIYVSPLCSGCRCIQQSVCRQFSKGD